MQDIRPLNSPAPPTTMLLSIHLATMAVLATWMLGMGERDMALPVVTLIAAIGSVVLTDWLGWFRLHRVLANVAMLIAAFVSLGSFFELGSHEQLIAIANLLVYVQMVLLFQQKNRRIHGQLAVFSLLQVVVAALLNDSLEFGLLLLVYLTIASFGLTLFFIERELERLGQVKSMRWPWPWRRAEATACSSMLGSVPEVHLATTTAQFRHHLVSWKLVGPVLSMIIVSLVFTTVFFYSAPRSEGRNWKGMLRAFTVVGFSPEISFHQMGKVLQSNQRVMRVSFNHAATGKPYTVIGQPYFRGCVLAKYLTARQRWVQGVETGPRAGDTLSSAPLVRELVIQDVLMEPTGRPLLFSVTPAYAAQNTPDEIHLRKRSRRLFRHGTSNSELAEEFRYRIATTAFRFGTQTRLVPCFARAQTRQARREMRWILQELRYIDNRAAFPKLIALADQIVQEQSADKTTYTNIKALERHFIEADRYTYSLDFDEINKLRAPGVDPVEDFAINHRTGHCEYFASALTLMLRSQGIPARMVIGYRGGEYNAVGRYFVVRQLHAHAWVEAYLTAAEIPEKLRDSSETYPSGGWLRLDPTPSSDEDQMPQRSVVDRVTQSFDYARWLWNDYVLRLTAERQKQTPFGPLASTRSMPLDQLVDQTTWMELGKWASRFSVKRLLEQPVSWRGGLVAVIACLVAYGAYQLLPHLLAMLPMFRFHWPRRSTRTIPSVAFYQKLETLLARMDLRRRPSQTPRELAEQAARLLENFTARASVVHIPGQIVEAYYRARFGEWTPDAHSLAEIQQQLERLEKAVRSATHADSAP